jgi:hypothetical protein
MLTTLLFMSLDAVVEAEDDWQFPYFDEEMLPGFSAQWDRAAAVLLGRRTFEGFHGLRGRTPKSAVVRFLRGVPSRSCRSSSARGPRLFDGMDATRVDLRVAQGRVRDNGVLEVVYKPA